MKQTTTLKQQSYAFWIGTTLLMASGCKAPNHAQHFPAKHPCLIRLSVGMPMDSAKQLLRSAGWTWDSVEERNGYLYLKSFNNHFPNVRTDYRGMAQFHKNKLRWFEITSNIGDHSTEKDYRELEGYASSVYGPPSDSMMRRYENLPTIFWAQDSLTRGYQLIFYSGVPGILFSTLDKSHHQ